MDRETIERNLLTIAERRFECYKTLVSLARRQQSILLDSSHSELAANIGGFDPLLHELEQLGKREASCMQLIDNDNWATADTQRQHQDLGRRTAEQALSLRALTQTNAQLLINTKRLVNFTLDAIFNSALNGQSLQNAAQTPAIILDARV